MPTSTSILIAGVMTLIIIFNAIKIYQPKNQGQTILQDLALVAIFLTIISFLIFDISILHRIKFIDTESKITYTSIGKGFIAIIAIYLFYQRLEKQQKQIDTQINQRVDDRFNSAIDLLGSSETSVRTGAIYALHELAIEEEKYRRQIAQIMCSHIRSKTDETEYKDTHSERPSNEIQTTIDLLFKEKGLYGQEFARVVGFPKANLSHAYLMGANFGDALCRGAIFWKAECQGAVFMLAQCQGANFGDAQCQGAYFWKSQCQGTIFKSAQCQDTNFGDAQCQGANFMDAELQGRGLTSVECQGADFAGAQSDMPFAIQIEGEINVKAIKAIEDAQPYLDNSWYEKMQKIIKENKGKDPEFKTYRPIHNAKPLRK